jgi:DNA-binding transcriptional MocR family regulator
MKKQKLPPFVPLFINMMDSPAWLEMSLGARVLYLAFKKRYNRKTQQAVFLSARIAAKELGVNKDTVSRWYRELQHFGFIMQVRGASFGPGRGRAAEFRLADERYKGKPPSMEFTYWNGTPFGPEAANFPSEKPGRKTGFPSEKPGHSHPKNPDGNPRFAHFSRPKNPDTSRKDSSHLLRGQSHRHREWQRESGADGGRT